MSGYSIALIRKLLANYAVLESGQLPIPQAGAVDYLGPRATRRGIAPAPFELAAMMKTDIDRAIQQLPPLFKFVVLAVDIDERDLGDCSFWLGGDIGYVTELEDKAVRRIAGILSGQREFRGGYRDGAGRKTEAKKRESAF